MQINLEIIASIAEEKEIENQQFVTYLKNKDSKEVDEIVLALNDIISSEIDCTQCGNCCKSLMINVSEEEANHLSKHLHQSRNEFENKYLEKAAFTQN